MKIEPSTFALSPVDSDEARALTNAINGVKIVGDAVTAELAQEPVDWSVVAGELIKVYQP